MRTPDLYFTSTNDLYFTAPRSLSDYWTEAPKSTTWKTGCFFLLQIHAQVVSTGEEDTRTELPSPILNTYLQAKGNANSRLNLQWEQPIAQNINRAWLVLPAFYTCSQDAFLQGFWSTICLLLLRVTSDAAKEKSGAWMFLSSPAASTKGISVHNLLAKGGPGWGDTQVSAGSWDTWWSCSVLLCISFILALFTPEFDTIQEGMLSLQLHS